MPETKKYSVIYADPPWRYDMKRGNGVADIQGGTLIGNRGVYVGGEWGGGTLTVSGCGLRILRMTQRRVEIGGTIRCVEVS